VGRQLPNLQAVARKSKTFGFGCRLRACPHGELAQDPGHVVLDRTSGENKAVCDLGVGQVLPEQNEHLELSPGQVAGIATGRSPRASPQSASPAFAKPAAHDRSRGLCAEFLKFVERAAQQVFGVGGGQRERGFVWRIELVPACGRALNLTF
jgi:hypothetical protein